MKTYTHPNGYKAEQCGLSDMYLVEPPHLSRLDHRCWNMKEQELLEFGFIEDKQEDWIDNYINDFAKQSKEIMKSGELLRKTSEQLNEIMLKEMKKILIKHLPK